MPIEERIAEVLSSPTASYWLKTALTAAMQRDVVDAAKDAEFLAELLAERADASLPALTPKWDLLDPA